MRSRSIPHDRSNTGFTLLEVMLAMSILLIIVVALTQAVVVGQMHAYQAIHEVRATSLAEAMIEEVLSLPYNDPDGASSAGPEAGETNRNNFDNADDYDGFAEDAGDVADLSGSVYPTTYQVFGRSVTATYTTISALGTNIDGLLIVVTVTDPRNRTWRISRFVPE